MDCETQLLYLFRVLTSAGRIPGSDKYIYIFKCEKLTLLLANRARFPSQALTSVSLGHIHIELIIAFGEGKVTRLKINYIGCLAFSCN